MDDARTLPARHKLDIDAYYALVGAGIIDEHDRVELIDGDIIDMAPIGSGHASFTDRLTETLVLACQGRAIVSVQNPVRLDRLSEPQPDVAVLRRRDDFYESARPSPADVLLLIEVADTSLRFDGTVKLPLYARAGIPEYWILDLQSRTLVAYSQPGPDGYAREQSCGPGDKLALVAAPDIIIPLAQVLR